MRYLLGVLAGILSGLAFTASSIAQKRAINALGTEAQLFRSLVKSPLWLAGFAAAFVIGAPLNMAAYMAIGPTLPPALNSIGLAAIPILARIFLGERSPVRSYAGAVVMALAVACIGLSGVAIAPESVNWVDSGFLLRAAMAVACVLGVSMAFIWSGLHSRSSGTTSLALAAGAAQALTNALMAPIAGQIGRLFSGNLGLTGFIIAGVTSVALAAVNFGAIAIGQLALRKGAVVVVIPLQQLPIQVVPLVFHIALYGGNFGTPAETAFLALGLVFLIAGSIALGGARTSPRGKVPAMANCLVVMCHAVPLFSLI
jgi:drug/metabolite transporter (DMT)-like permease